MSDYEGILQRLTDNGRQTQGHLQVKAPSGVVVFQCNTLELPWKNNDPVLSCYPPGVYEVQRRFTAERGWHWHILVPNRAWRLFHAGNFAASRNPKTGHADISGCTLVGNGYGDLDGDGQVEILSSTVTMQHFMRAVPVDQFRLHVLAPPALAV